MFERELGVLGLPSDSLDPIEPSRVRPSCEVLLRSCLMAYMRLELVAWALHYRANNLRRGTQKRHNLNCTVQEGPFTTKILLCSVGARSYNSFRVVHKLRSANSEYALQRAYCP